MTSDELPLIISVDDHLVEPGDLWSSRLPAAMVERGPHIVMAPIDEAPVLDGAMYIEKPGTSGRVVPWWHYEEHWYTLKRAIAAAGYAADEVTMDAVTYDEMRPGCWQPKARLEESAPSRSASARHGWTSPASIRGTGIRSIGRAPRRVPSSPCTSARARAPCAPAPTPPTRCRRR